MCGEDRRRKWGSRVVEESLRKFGVTGGGGIWRLRSGRSNLDGESGSELKDVVEVRVGCEEGLCNFTRSERCPKIRAPR